MTDSSYNVCMTIVRIHTVQQDHSGGLESHLLLFAIGVCALIGTLRRQVVYGHTWQWVRRCGGWGWPYDSSFRQQVSIMGEIDCSCLNQLYCTHCNYTSGVRRKGMLLYLDEACSAVSGRSLRVNKASADTKTQRAKRPCYAWNDAINVFNVYDLQCDTKAYTNEYVTA